MEILHNVSLKPYNTFGVDVIAKQFSELTQISELDSLTELNPLNLPLLIIGGGSNLLLLNNLNYWVILNQLKGIKITKEVEDEIYISVGAGEIWNDFVQYCVAQNWGGVENLSLIPGTVGAAPIQNIGAYGMDVSQTIESVTYWHLEEKKIKTITSKDCKFSYRESIFKNELKGKFIIIDVQFKLAKNNYNLNLSYGNVGEELDKLGITSPTIKDVSNAIIEIRSSKLPDPKIIGNSGSFFKNPEINAATFEILWKEYPRVPYHAMPNGLIKIPAAWLIEQSGWKGYRKGNHGVHDRQALVLVNYGDATGQQIFDLSKEIIQSVTQKFNITLEREVNIIK